MADPQILAEDFRATPWWWEGYDPPEDAPEALPTSADVLIVGGGYAGVSCALTLAEAGRAPLVLDAERLGWGASSRSGGQVTGGVNVGKIPGGGNAVAAGARRDAMLRDAAAGMRHLLDLIERHQIQCGWHPTGRLTALWTPAHRAGWEARLEHLNRHADAEARMMSREELRAELGSDQYAGGVLIGRAGHLHPAQLFGGLLAAARRAGARAHGGVRVTGIHRAAAGGSGRWRVETSRGVVEAGTVVIATNGYTGNLLPGLKRRLIPVTTHMIATEPLPPDLARAILPTNRAVSETRRVVNHYRLSPDGTRLLFGGRARFFPAEERVTAAILHRQMVKRFPQLAAIRVTHGWGGKVAVPFDYLPHIGMQDGIHYALGCNGSGVVMMNWLGHGVAQKILANTTEKVNAFDGGPMPTHPLFHGTPWFLPIVGTYYQARDWLDHRRA
ncbi:MULTISPECIES: NAD(P)/FAD-dependent oxidoreductase [Roseomonadaceae]|uniref:FAD-binding oxidoreductase n=1 Tax=Falsiroseomonas oleicola TaxID=2801474 RepID=A0ABS6H1J4_9PROT|nr:FAD-binding oxidoreductase [Roseomonas oleicola]MBU8542514.1 FAD-binding oxidoreductase [Roseomonas oleicola]